MKKDIHYGIHSVTALLESSPDKIRQLWCAKGRDDKKLQHIIDLAHQAGINVQRTTSKNLDKKISGSHQGVIAEVIALGEKYNENDLDDLLAQAESPLILILDGIEDPHNLGACLRSADAAGVTVVIAPKDRAVGITPVVSKVACGAAETVPFIRVTNLARVMEQLKKQGVWIYGAAGEASESLFKQDLKGPVAIAMGAEAKGLRRLSREQCDHLVKIPMQGSVESLNVSVATGICLFEVLRQRSK